jgi:hypothetical protein
LESRPGVCRKAIQNLIYYSVLELLTPEEFKLTETHGRKMLYKNFVDNMNTTSDVQTTSLNILLNKAIGRPMEKSLQVFVTGHLSFGLHEYQRN